MGEGIEVKRPSKERLGEVRKKVKGLKEKPYSPPETPAKRRRAFFRQGLVELIEEKKVTGKLKLNLIKLANEHTETRLQAVNQLRLIWPEYDYHDPHIVVEPLIQALKDEHWQVRRAAADCLEHVGAKKAFKPLTRLLNDEKPEVRGRAVSTLSNLASQHEMEAVAFPLVKKAFLDHLKKGKLSPTFLSSVILAFTFDMGPKSVEAAKLAMEFFKKEPDGWMKQKGEILSLADKFLKEGDLKKALNLALKDESVLTSASAVELMGKNYLQFLKGADARRLAVASSFLRGWEKRNLLLGILVLRKDMRKNCPLSSNDWKGREYLKNLKQDITDKKLSDVKKVIKWEKGLK
jgi:hypothetical protein